MSRAPQHQTNNREVSHKLLSTQFPVQHYFMDPPAWQNTHCLPDGGGLGMNYTLLPCRHDAHLHFLLALTVSPCLSLPLPFFPLYCEDLL